MQKKINNRKLLFPAIALAILFVNTILACNSKGRRTRSFKLTQDSTFIGAWGGMLHDEQTGYFPKLTKSFNMIFVYSKDNKIFISNRPEVFAKDTTEEVALLYYREFLSHDGDIPAFDDSYKVESETLISKVEDEYSKWIYEIDRNNHLKCYTFTKTLTKETQLEYFTFQPYYFKTIKNPEN
jgi:hypothetical protein